MEVGTHCSYLFIMEDKRCRKRRKGPQLYDLTKIKEDIRRFERKSRECIHLAAEMSEKSGSESRSHLREAFDFNSGLNEYRDEWDNAIKLHAVVAVTCLSRYHPVFRQIDIPELFCLIYRFASMPSVPDTGPVPTRP